MSINSICAIIVTYNTGKNYIKNFKSIIGQIDMIVIVDNGSNSETFETLEYIKNHHDNVIVIYNKDNLGLAKAQNIGIEKSIELGFEWVLLLDDDSRAEQDMISNMKDFYNNYSEKDKIAILASDIKNEPFYKKTSYATVNNNFFKIRKKFIDEEFFEVYFAIASGSLLRTSVFKLLGKFRDDFFIDYIDVEYGLRIFLAGFKNIVISSAKLNHRLGDRKEFKLGKVSIVTSNHNHIRKYYIYRNRIKIWKLYFKTIPSFVMYDIIISIAFLIKTLVFEQSRLKKAKYIIQGIYKGVSEKVKNM